MNQDNYPDWVVSIKSLCYLRFFHWVISYNHEHICSCKTILIWSARWIFNSCCILASHLSWTKKYLLNYFCMLQYISPENFVYQLRIIKSIFCWIFLGRFKSLIIYCFCDGLSICCLALVILIFLGGLISSNEISIRYLSYLLFNFYTLKSFLHF